MIKRRWILVAAAGAMMTANLFAKQGVVTTKDGHRYEGDVTEKADSIVVVISGVQTVIDRGNVATLAYSDAFEKQYADRLAKLAPDDVPGRIALARWAFDQKHYDKARDACDSALTIDPNNKEATDLARLIRSQMRMEQGKGQGNTTITPPAQSNPKAPGSSAKTISPADVNSIRLHELSSNDKSSIRFENDVKKRFVEFAKKSYSEFNKMKPVDQALAIIAEGDAKMVGDVKVTGDPGAMQEFRKTILPVMLNSCATVNCHGNSAAGGVQFITPAASDVEAYTNFYLLTQLGKGVGSEGGGFFGGSSERKMIERGQGDRSVLANYMLPHDQAEVPHPEVQGYAFVFRSKDDPKYKQLVKWMNESLKSPAPDYGIDYDIPKINPSTQPAKK